MTVVREKGGACSLIELFKLLSPFNTLEDICDVLWDLSEAKRDYWRRLITFNSIIPKSLRELKTQMDILWSKDNGKKYRFEKKIDWVYKDVADCCVNSVYFACLVMDVLKIYKYEYINNTVNAPTQVP